MAARVTTPWGWWSVLAAGPDWKVKHLVVAAGQRTSLQKHQERMETLTVLSPKAWLWLHDDKWLLYRGDQYVVPVDTWHRLAAGSMTEAAEFIEVQLGACSEEDVVRLEDDYGRADGPRP